MITGSVFRVLAMQREIEELTAQLAAERERAEGLEGEVLRLRRGLAWLQSHADFAGAKIRYSEWEEYIGALLSPAAGQEVRDGG